MAHTKAFPHKSEFSRLANLLAKADHSTFSALRLNGQAQDNLNYIQRDLSDTMWDRLAKANMEVMDAPTRVEAKKVVREMESKVRELRTILQLQVRAAKAVMKARFPEHDEDL